MHIIKKNFFYIFLTFYFIIGSITSLNTGISHDEFHEEKNWKFNVNLAKNITNHIFNNKEYDTSYDNYTDKYYGIGFQLISQPIQTLLKNTLIKNKKLDDYGAKLTGKHWVVFSFFFISGIFVYLILKKIVNNRIFCSFVTIIYLLYPYLFGQSLFSPKDIPFLSIWVVCTYFSFVIFEKLIENNILKNFDLFILALLTAFLLSIRVGGVLIFFQYIVTFVIFANLEKINLISFVKRFYLKILFFVFVLFFFTYIFYPIFWINPLTIFDAINHMGSFYHDICTLTLGTCMNAKNLPSTYIPIWFSVKLPFIILIGILLIPFTEKKIFIEKKIIIFFGTLLVIAILIPLFLIFRKVHLYDEIRHIMFLIPIFFILGSVSLYFFSKRIFYILGIFTIFVFIYENIKINPYQYVWFNLPSRSIDLSKKFELEYQGISGKEIAKYISNSKDNDICIIATPSYTVEPYLDQTQFNCIDQWPKIDTDYKRPFLAVQHVRNIKRGKPFQCETVFEENFKLLFHQKKFVMGKLLKCS